MITKEFLEHYGTKGMKWGVRKKPGSGVKKSKSLKAKIAAKKPQPKASAPKPTRTKTGGKSKKTKGLSDKELQSRINRLNMEKQYRKLKSENPGALTRGRRTATGIIGAAGKKATGRYLSNVIFKNLIQNAGDRAGRRSTRVASLTRR